MADTSQVRAVVIARDPISGSGLTSLLFSEPGIVPVTNLETSEHDLLPTYRPDVVLWDLSWLNENDQANLQGAVGDDEGRAHGVPFVAVASDRDTAALLWLVGARSILHRSTSAPALISALRSTALGLWTLAPAVAPVIARPPASGLSEEHEALTTREIEVLDLLAKGLTNRAIGRRLTISEHTVRFHVNSILAKLNAESRTEAVVKATKAGLILL